MLLRNERIQAMCTPAKCQTFRQRRDRMSGRFMFERALYGLGRI